MEGHNSKIGEKGGEWPATRRLARGRVAGWRSLAGGRWLALAGGRWLAGAGLGKGLRAGPPTGPARSSSGDQAAVQLTAGAVFVPLYAAVKPHDVLDRAGRLPL
jgi:hypothetical protein